jgi:hypothetical protein
MNTGGKTQFCVDCGDLNSLYVSSCAACGAKLALTEIDPAIAEAARQAEIDAREAQIEAEFQRKVEEDRLKKIEQDNLRILRREQRKPMMKKLKIFGGSAGAVVAVLVALPFIPFPTPVAVEVEVTATAGGVFDESCNLTDAAREAGATQLKVVDYGTVPTDTSGPDLLFTQIDGKCIGAANVSVSKNGTYDLYVAGQLIGDLNAEEVELGSAKEKASIVIENDISGSMILADTYSNCKDTEAGIKCDVPLGRSLFKANLKAETCYGTNSFVDFGKSGTKIAFKGIGTGEVTSGKLGAGVPSLTDLKTGYITCSYDYKVDEVIHDDKGYSVTVGTHKFQVSIDELKSSKFKLDHTFKN